MHLVVNLKILILVCLIGLLVGWAGVGKAFLLGLGPRSKSHVSSSSWNPLGDSNNPLFNGLDPDMDPIEYYMLCGEHPQASFVADKIQDSGGAHTNVAAIERMIEQRMSARYAHNYDEADKIKDILFREFGVSLYDSLGTWEAADGSFGTIRKYSGAYRDKTVPVNPIDCPLSTKVAQRRVLQRTQLRREWKYAEADRIRDELAAAGVELMDASNEWRSYDGKLGGMQSYDRDETE